uniref:Uncharacterized protein n=1 Tax=Timema tahoe TaxID=61484 RepID=A0A7R9IES4_9NEOP|nr:unnamed protein product [Timema tahoe]
MICNLKGEGRIWRESSRNIRRDWRYKGEKSGGPWALERDWRRASDECNKKQPSDCDTLEYRNGEGK